MNPLQEQTLLNQTQAEINRIALSAFDRLLSNIREGENPRDAIRNAQSGFVGDYEDALLSAFNQILLTSIGRAELRNLNIGGLKLSDKLYKNSRAVEASALMIINDHAKGFHDARKLALQLYEGYQFRSEERLGVRAPLPKYFRAAFGDDEAFRQLWDRDYTGSKLKGLADHAGTGPELARLYARINAKNLKTPALQAAYLQALDAVEQGAGEQRLKTLLKTAYYERNRYLSNRIAQTELHRAYTDRTAVEIMADPKLDYVKIEMSSTHPRPDICDLIASADYYGMGAGVYPKAEAPKPPFHPFCLPGDALVTASGRVTAVSKRWFDGDMAIITTASGKRLASTINHPILTPGGWVGAGLLNIGDKVISRIDPVSVGGGVVVNNEHYNVPTRISDIADAFFGSREVSSRKVPGTAEDFHGDGMTGQITVIGANRKLWNRLDTSSTEICTDGFFKFTDTAKASLFGECIPNFEFKRSGFSPDGIMSRFNLMNSLFLRLFAPLYFLLFRRRSFANPLFDKSFVNNVPTDAKFFRELQNGSSGDVFIDDIINVERHNFIGHVYNLETEQGHYTCNGIVTHNCRCVAVPVAWAPGTPNKKPNAERDYLNRLSIDEARQVAGSSEKMLMVKNGADLDDIINKGVDSMYRLRRLGEFDRERRLTKD